METESLLSLSLLLEYQEHANKVSDIVPLTHTHTRIYSHTPSPGSAMQVYGTPPYRMKFTCTFTYATAFPYAACMALPRSRQWGPPCGSWQLRPSEKVSAEPGGFM